MYIEEPDGSMSVVPVKAMEQYNTNKLNKLELKVLELERRLNNVNRKLNEEIN